MSFDLPPDIQKEKDEKKKIIGGTKMEQERWRKKNVGETEDRLDAIGSPDEKKGIKAAAEAYKEHTNEVFRIKSDRVNWLDEKSRFTKDKRLDYFRHVKTLVDYELVFLDLPPKYSVKSEVTDRGIKLVLKDRFGQIHMGGFTPSGLGFYDEQACRTSVNKIDDLISKLEENPPSGIYLP